MEALPRRQFLLGLRSHSQQPGGMNVSVLKGPSGSIQILQNITHSFTCERFSESLLCAEHGALHLGYRSEACRLPSPVPAPTDVSLAGETDNQSWYLLRDPDEDTRQCYRSS